MSARQLSLWSCPTGYLWCEILASTSTGNHKTLVKDNQLRSLAYLEPLASFAELKEAPLVVERSSLGVVLRGVLDLDAIYSPSDMDPLAFLIIHSFSAQAAFITGSVVKATTVWEVRDPVAQFKPLLQVYAERSLFIGIQEWNADHVEMQFTRCIFVNCPTLPPAFTRSRCYVVNRDDDTKRQQFIRRLLTAGLVYGGLALAAFLLR